MCNKGIGSQVSINILNWYPQSTLNWYSIDIPSMPGLKLNRHSIDISVNGQSRVNYFSTNSSVCQHLADNQPTVEQVSIKRWPSVDRDVYLFIQKQINAPDIGANLHP